MKLHFASLLILLYSMEAFGQGNGITIDELYNDWNTSMPTYTDGLDNPGGLDLIDMQVTNDDRYLYLKLTVNRELCLGNSLIPQDIWLHIDADNNPNTGFAEQSGYGTELSVNMNGHYAWFNVPNPSVQVNFGDIQIQMGPTVSATTFEMALPRNVKPDGQNLLFTGDTIRIAFNDDLNNDRMPNSGSVFSYVFQNNNPRNWGPSSLDRRKPSDIRVVSHNILFNNGFSNSAIGATERVVKRLNADIYCFQECSEAASSIQSYFDTWLALPNGQSWQVGKDGTRVVVSRWPFSRTWFLNRKHAYLVDAPDSISAKDLLIVNGHLSCCTNNSGRQDQVDEFAQFLLNLKDPNNANGLAEDSPIIFVGDMNFVGFAQQYETVITGDIQNTQTYGLGAPLDWDGTDLGDARPLHMDSNFVYTWRDLQGDGFPPGRLDYQFYSDAVLQKENAFILDTERMDSTQLLNNTLNFTDTRVIADHLPVVVDYSIKTSGLGFQTPANRAQNWVEVYPNPATDLIHLDSKVPIEGLALYDPSGTKVFEINNPSHQLKLPDLANGSYILILQLKDQKTFTTELLIRN